MKKILIRTFFTAFLSLFFTLFVSNSFASELPDVWYAKAGKFKCFITITENNVILTKKAKNSTSFIVEPYSIDNDRMNFQYDGTAITMTSNEDDTLTYTTQEETIIFAKTDSSIYKTPSIKSLFKGKKYNNAYYNEFVILKGVVTSDNRQNKSEIVISDSKNKDLIVNIELYNEPSEKIEIGQTITAYGILRATKADATLSSDGRLIPNLRAIYIETNP